MKRALALTAVPALPLFGTACADKQDDVSATAQKSDLIAYLNTL